ncbi:MAG: DUF2975 domain-containing protein [Gemella sp.]|nr:DUF2975 domain-containing protein [Gemella sp.]
MKEKKVRNKFLQVVSYILRGIAFLLVIFSLLFLSAFTFIRISHKLSEGPRLFAQALTDVAFMGPFKTTWIFVWEAISGIIFAYILLLMAKFVANVSRDIIFDRENVRYLRKMTISAIVVSFVITSEGIVDISSLFLALTFFLFSIILSRAITIAEEQEFTV